jgi:hypothetical protein
LCPNCHRKAHYKKFDIEFLKAISLENFDWKKYYRQKKHDFKYIDIEQFVNDCDTLPIKQIMLKYKLKDKTIQ